MLLKLMIFWGTGFAVGYFIAKAIHNKWLDIQSKKRRERTRQWLREVYRWGEEL